MTITACLANLGLCFALAATGAGAQPDQPKPKSTPYPGTLTLQVDATDLDRKLLRVRQRIPAKPGPLTLYFPRWIPGHHSPSGDVARLAGLQFTARGEPLAWRRDALDTHAFLLDVPRGAEEVEATFEHVSPTTAASGRVVVTREVLNLQWNNLLLYPAGHEARAITVQVAVRLPEGWQYGTALRGTPDPQGGVVFAPVSLETLVDSPVFAGRYFQRIELDGAGARPVALNLVADRADQLKASPEQIEAHRELVRQADKLFGTRHFAHYDFLLALSDELGGIGLEHHQSSENGVKPDYFKDWDKTVASRTLLPHEYVHSWNGKYRRPRDLWTPHYNAAMQNSLLWLYEGQTQYWGNVLAARSGLVKPEPMRDDLAQVAAAYEQRAGRAWRNLQDTTNDPIMSGRTWQRDWRNWQRGADYYDEAVLVWLDADTLIRERSGGRRSLDDFARAFFGGRDGDLGPVGYGFDDIVAALDAVQPHDWTRFLRERLDGHGPGAPLDGLARAGWQLEYTDTPSDNFKDREADAKNTDYTHSLGLQVANADAKLVTVAWDSPAFRAGVAPGAMLVAVNRRAYKPEVLKDAITANKDGAAPIELLLRENDFYRSVRIDYRGGLRYPALKRIEGREDRLGAVWAPRP